MGEFTAQIVHIGQLFAHPYQIEAPSYQRSFAWSTTEGDQLLEDIVSALDEARATDAGAYFLGTMLFIERPAAPSRLKLLRAKPMRMLEVVDGFQRLTTLTILFCVLRDLEAETDGTSFAKLQAAVQVGPAAKARPRLSLRQPDEIFFSKHVREPGATRVSSTKSGLSQAEANILNVRDHIIAALRGYDAVERRRLVDFLFEGCCAVMVTTGDIDRAHRIFTVLNARGKPLARNDILKAILLGNVPRDAAARCMAIWEDAATHLGVGFESLFSHLRAMYGRPGGQVISGVLEVCQASGGAQAFIERTLQPAARIIADISNAHHAGSPNSERIASHLRYLGWHSFSDWIPPAMLWWLNRGEDAQGLERFLARLDRLAFGAKVLGMGGTKRARRFGAVASAIRDGRDLYDPDSPLEFTRPELRTIQHNLRDLHARNPAVAKQMLLRLTDLKSGMPESLSLPKDMTVEHVLPRTLRSGCQWREWHPDPEDRELCTECLGNLVLVTKAQNDKAGNHDFGRKLQVYFNARGALPVAINESLRGKAEWKPADIRAREAEMVGLVEELWQFGMPVPKAKAAGIALVRMATEPV
jgi:hypothetical protein